MKYLLGNGRIKFTPEGGLAIKVKNNTGHTSIKGELVKASATADDTVDIAAANDVVCIGAVYDAGVLAGNYMWIVVAGIAQVLVKDSTAVTRGQWMGVSDADGRAYPDADPIGAGAHNREVGHALESSASGTNVLCKIAMHFN